MVTTPVRGFLLTMGGYMGSLAAARDLGRAGIPVVLAEPDAGTYCQASRYVTQWLQCPPLSPSAPFVDWLVTFGQANPGYVLYPTSDELCWLMDRHQDVLSQHYHLYQPARGQMWQLLNKDRLHEWCLRLGVDVPEQWQLGPMLSLDQLLAEIEFPVLLKPETQAGIHIQKKGVQIADAETLRAELGLAQSLTFRETMLSHAPDVASPMIQRYYPEALDGIYSLGGFYCPEQDLFLVRGSKKLLQMPYRLGTGVCFEARAVHSATARKLKALMEAVGYRGAFEAEYIHLPDQDRYLLIDLNVRFYGQMAFEIARGIPVAQLCYHASLGDWQAVKRLATQSVADNGQGYDRARIQWLLKIYANTLRLGGTISAQASRDWKRWSVEGRPIDLIHEADDPSPAKFQQRKYLRGLFRHPRSSIRQYLGH